MVEYLIPLTFSVIMQMLELEIGSLDHDEKNIDCLPFFISGQRPFLTTTIFDRGQIK